jgi:ribosome-associated protein
MKFELSNEFIELSKLLKVTALVESGGVAGLVIKDEMVLVDGLVETRKRCKIRPGQVVEFNGEVVEVVSI